MFGERVRKRRQQLGLSQDDLAGRAGIDPKTIRNIEAGRSTPRPSTARRLADALQFDGTARAQFFESTTEPVEREPGRVRTTVVPAQLPADLAGFAGRQLELDWLDRLHAAAGHAPRAAAVCALSGTAGVGKTTLAVHWAHRMADRFPDGQLYVNLRGFDVRGPELATTAALRGFLDALGVPAEQVPAEPDAQVGLYRSLLAGKRVLIVLDNARDAGQARPLLPGTSTALTLVTSRDQLTPLIAVEGANPFNLTVLSTVEARALLVGRIGADRVAAEPGAVDAIVAACAGLPLALAIAAARAQQTDFPLESVAAELNDAGRRLDALDAGNPSTRMRTVFSMSYATLPPATARLFRLAALHPGPELSVPAAASLAGQPQPHTNRLVTELRRANLLIEERPGRYTIHELLRSYASDLGDEHDPVPTRRDALGRLLDHYTHTTHAADRLLHPGRGAIAVPLGPPASGVVLARFADDQQAMGWLDAEWRVVLTMLGHAADSGFARHAWQLAWSLDTYLTRRRVLDGLVFAWQTGLRAARSLDDPTASAYAHRYSVYPNIELGRYDEALAHAGQALDLYGRVGDRAGQLHLHRNVAFLYWRRGDLPQALHHARHARDLLSAEEDHISAAAVLNDLGWYHAELGDYEPALACCEEALRLFQLSADVVGAASALDSLGYVYHRLGRHAESVDSYERSVALHRELDDRSQLVETLNRLGDAYQANGDLRAARDVWYQTLDMFTELDHPAAASVHAKLDALNRQRLKPAADD